MIVTRLEGGLGNQLFQFAAGRALALRTCANLALDLYAFERTAASDSPRRFELVKLGIRSPKARPHDIKRAMGRTNYQSFLPERVARKIWGRPKTFIGETGPESIRKLYEATGNAYLSGYWQSELYFVDFREQIRTELREAARQVVLEKDLLKAVLSTNSVSLHVRRGDYVNNPITNAFHGTCGPDYYRAAVERIRAAVENPSFFGFSDDIEWCRANLQIGSSVTYVDKTFGIPAEAEMLLMSKCKHNIIANSSFSWWGAWLNENVGKMVIAPKKWFSGNDPFDRERIPDTWFRL